MKFRAASAGLRDVKGVPYMWLTTTILGPFVRSMLAHLVTGGRS